jgi:hypothetical protein
LVSNLQEIKEFEKVKKLTPVTGAIELRHTIKDTGVVKHCLPD